ncbi:hypothetical protein ACFRIB_00700 [Streptomyces mirabilis]|uniref:hypothetical protein n=1 Tax=Streptomyces mirabilis TaxID=68239 RepID=UPI0036C527F0
MGSSMDRGTDIARRSPRTHAERLVRWAGGPGSGALRAVDLGSDGSGGELITVAAGGSAVPVLTANSRALNGTSGCRGRTVYRHTVHRTTASSRLLLERAGWSPQSVVCHSSGSVGSNE